MTAAPACSPATGPTPPGGETSGTLRSHMRPGSNSLSGTVFRENLNGELYETATAVPLRSEASTNYQFVAPSTSSAAGSPAKTSRSPAAVQVSLPLALDCSSSSSDWLASYSLAGFSWKTSLACSAPTGATTSGSSSLPWETQGTAWGGECWTRGGSECPSGAAACSLSDILEGRVPPRFSLSPKACTGILRRAAKRGRSLPTALEQALRTASASPPTAPPTRPTA